MSVNKKYTFLIGALLLFVILFYIFLSGEKSKSSDAESGDALVMAPRSRQLVVLQPEIARLNDPLPVSEANIASVYDELKMRADAGNAKAACRLGMELQRCYYNRQINERRKKNDAPEDILDEKEGDPDIYDADILNSDDEFRLAHVNANKVCEGLSESQIDVRMRYLRQAADAEVPDAMVNYASGIGFDGLALPLKGKAYEVWRRDAKSILDRALRLGVPDAAQIYEAAYYDDSTLFNELIPNDPVQSETYRQLWLRLGNLAYRQHNKTLSGRDYQIAVRNAELMFTKYFSKNTDSQNSKFVAIDAHSYPRGFESPMCID